MTISTNKYKKMRGFDGMTRSAKLFRRKQLEITPALFCKGSSVGAGRPDQVSVTPLVGAAHINRWIES